MEESRIEINSTNVRVHVYSILTYFHENPLDFQNLVLLLQKTFQEQKNGSVH